MSSDGTEGSVSTGRSPIIRFDHASFGFPGLIALKDISLPIYDGEFVGVIGPNGSGKTTLCRAVLGLLPPVEGHLHIFDCACSELRCHHRAQIGYLPQKGVVDRNFPVTVLETVMMGRYGALGLLKRPGKKDRQIAMDALAQVDMASHEDTALGHLSGGQQQRVFIARALARLVLLKTRLYAAGPPAEVLKPEILHQVYGKELVITEKDLVIVEDYHHHH